MCVWHPEADSIEFNSTALKILYRNNRVDSFLNSMRELGVSAIKGQGKTFLIKAKRFLLNQKGSLLLLQKDSVMIDGLSADINIRPRQKKFLSSYTNWLSLWKVAIVVTILQNPEVNGQYIAELLKKCSEATNVLLNVQNSNYRPSVMFYELIEMPVEELNKVFADLPRLLQALSYVDRAICVFIDKVDQAFSHHAYQILGETDSNVGYRNASLWHYSQLALANAAYDIFTTTNQHVKVYFTIRQEALLGAEKTAPNTYRNFSPFITRVEYSKDDLYRMFALYVSSEANSNLREPNYKKQNPEKAFVGIDKFKHGYVNHGDVETLFSYIYRHTLGRSSDIQQICYDLYMEDVNSLDVDKIRHIVNTSARKLLKQYVSELEPFTLKTDGVIHGILSSITTNVFEINYMRSICRRYMLLSCEYDSCKMQCEHCSDIYPFAQLYNIGLIGYLHTNDVYPDQYEQRFLSASERIILGEEAHIVPSKLFFLHPSASDWARDLRGTNRRNFTNSHNVIIGNGCLCTQEALKETLKEIEITISELEEENVFISSTMNYMQNERKRVAEAIVKKGYYPVYCESPKYYIDSHYFSHDACINEILKCGNFITIFGKEYGGEYSGIEFDAFAKEIVAKSNGKIKKPSITLMEYYVARSHGRKYVVLMNEDVKKYRDSHTYQARKLLSWEEKSDLDKMEIVYDFLNHLILGNMMIPIGNMIAFYRDEMQLQQIVSNCTFQNNS